MVGANIKEGTFERAFKLWRKPSTFILPHKYYSLELEPKPKGPYDNAK
jgi:hypothetical protein